MKRSVSWMPCAPSGSNRTEEEEEKEEEVITIIQRYIIQNIDHVIK
jgi:hypothetical protein